MNWSNKMPVTSSLLFSSWLIAIGGILASAFLIITKFKEINALIYGILLLFGSLLLAALVRMFANIGQMVFDIKADNRKANNEMRELKERSSQERKSQLQELKSQLQELESQLQAQADALTRHSQILGNLKDTFTQVNCDSKDVNQNINQIRDFFEKIERHLGLKK